MLAIVKGNLRYPVNKNTGVNDCSDFPLHGGDVSKLEGRNRTDGGGHCSLILLLILGTTVD